MNKGMGRMPMASRTDVGGSGMRIKRNRHTLKECAEV
jgi:hypothetical protein